MYAMDQNFLNLADYLRKNQELLGVQPELAQIDGTISCAGNPKLTVAICGKSNSYFDYLLKLILPDPFPWNDELYSVPFKLVYGEMYSVKYLADGQVKETVSVENIPLSKCEFIEISVNSPLLADKELLFITLLSGNEKIYFDNYISACDCVILCPNLSNAIEMEYHSLCKLIQDQWQQPERVRAIAIDINNLSLPGTMIRALSAKLGTDHVIPYKVIDSFKDISENRENVNSLLKLEKDRHNLKERTYSSIHTAYKKMEVCLQKYISQKETMEKEIKDFSKKINAFNAQAVIHIPRLGTILDENTKSVVFQETAEYISFVQSKISKEIHNLNKEELDAYVPVYYSNLISDFIKQMSSSVLLPAAQNKFDEIIEDILDCYQGYFSKEIPEELLEKTRIAKGNFFSFVDRTNVDKIDVGIGIVESTVLYVLVYENPILCFFSKEIVLLTNRLKQEIFNIYDRYIRSTESYAKEISNRVNAVLDENLQNIPKQIEDSMFPALEKNMRKALENFVYGASKPMEEELAEKKEALDHVQKTIKEIQNIKNTLDGLISKCE